MQESSTAELISISFLSWLAMQLCEQMMEKRVVFQPKLVFKGLSNKQH